MQPANRENAAAERMVKLQIENRDVRDTRVLEVMRRLPRHLFIPPGSLSLAYEDHPVSIGHGQTISQPYMVAFMTQALELRGGERVLEVGTGSGYQTAILAELCRAVFTVERIPELAAAAESALMALRYGNISLRVGDGSEGWPEHAPFDGILVAAAAPAIPQGLREQLADNGVMVIPVGDWRRTQEILVARRVGGTVTVERSIGCRFVPLIGTGGFPE
ncbi:MAG TPA: protein-L-isoaspartate(D-aspartate) O-methyltransferase [Spirochaetia bacterium]|nr:protein-L-isoaspartate(D-aspartate) O-methyltransferase [Spirochaetia bacterium]